MQCIIYVVYIIVLKKIFFYMLPPKAYLLSSSDSLLSSNILQNKRAGILGECVFYVEKENYKTEHSWPSRLVE